MLLALYTRGCRDTLALITMAVSPYLQALLPLKYLPPGISGGLRDTSLVFRKLSTHISLL